MSIVLEELLHWLGVPGSIILVLSAGLTVYHGRHLLTIGALLGRWLRFGGVLLILAAVAVSGLVPGVRLSIDLGALASGLGELLRLLPVDMVLRWLPL